jgi:uncharacterized protein (DUF305 family)
LKRYRGLGLLVLLLLALTLTLASCSGGGTGSGEQGSGDQDDKEVADAIQVIDHKSMDHGDMQTGSGGTMDASNMLMENGEYSDERFIDAMVPHHQGAVEMAEVALDNAEHPELRQLAGDIIADQQAEIARLRAIKEREFGSSEVPIEMSSKEMEMMGMMEDHAMLAEQEPFDKAFIDAMIPHHVAAIQMANAAIENTANEEIRELAQGIVDLQQSEIEQMTGWRKEWYPEGEA